MKIEEIKKRLDERKTELAKAEANLEKVQKMAAAIANGVVLLQGSVKELTNMLKEAQGETTEAKPKE